MGELQYCEQEQKYTDTSYTQNSKTVGVVVNNKKILAPQMYRLCIQQKRNIQALL